MSKAEAIRARLDPELPMTIWRGEKPWRYVAAIGRPDQMKSIKVAFAPLGCRA